MGAHTEQQFNKRRRAEQHTQEEGGGHPSLVRSMLKRRLSHSDRAWVFVDL